MHLPLRYCAVITVDDVSHIDFSLGFGSTSTSSKWYREAVVGDRLKRIVVYTVLSECRYVDGCWLVVAHAQSTTQGHGEDMYPQI